MRILGVCPDVGDDGPPPTPAPTIVPRDCSNNVGTGICEDASGARYDSCARFINPLNFSRGRCRKAAESVPNSVGWQYGVSGNFPFACVVFFDDADSGDDVKPLCPPDFDDITVSSNSGTGFPKAGGQGLLACYSCEE